MKTGNRVRDRRMHLGIKQAELAEMAGISPSYLNLIEHNRRRIGGKLLLKLAEHLQLSPQALSKGAAPDVLQDLHQAGQASGLSNDALEDASALAERFPDWARVIKDAQARIAGLEHRVASLMDRMAHDPYLSDAIHELLTNTAAIRSTAEILAETQALDPQWQRRFQMNLQEDSRRLAESTQTLAQYLQSDDESAARIASPSDEVAAFLEANSYSFPEVEKAETPEELEKIAARSDVLTQPASQEIAVRILEQMYHDANKLPLNRLEAALTDGLPDPVALARNFDTSVAVVLRRLAMVPSLGAGLVVCDRAGAIIFRKPIAGFATPRIGACCPLWPLFSVLGHPGLVVRQTLVQVGQVETTFAAFATAEAQEAARYNASPLVHAVMLLLPHPGGASQPEVRRVGTACPTCPRQNCAARRVPTELGL